MPHQVNFDSSHIRGGVFCPSPFLGFVIARALARGNPVVECVAFSLPEGRLFCFILRICHCERSEAISWDCRSVQAPRNDRKGAGFRNDKKEVVFRNDK
jgi:hypothetical protein